MGNYKESFKDLDVVCAYDLLSDDKKKVLESKALELGIDSFEYLEEILIDYTKAYEIATLVIKNAYIVDIPVSELAKIILYFGICVKKREPYEISFLTDGSQILLEVEKEFLKSKYEINLYEIYDKVWQYLDSTKVTINKHEKSINELYDSLSKQQRSILHDYSNNIGVSPLEYLEELLIDKDNAIRLGRYINATRGFWLRMIDPEDIKYLLLYYGIGVQKRNPEELYILEKHPSAISLDYFIEGAKNIILNSTDELLLIYDEAMNALSASNSNVNKDFSI